MKRALKPVFLILGFTFLAIGLIGVVVPVLPTTPFMILALIMFAESSQKFHDWLYHHRLFGPALQQWRRNRVIPLKAKIAALSMMLLSYSYLVFFANMPAWALVSVALFMAGGAWFILDKPSRAPDDSLDDK